MSNRFAPGSRRTLERLAIVGLALGASCAAPPPSDSEGLHRDATADGSNAVTDAPVDARGPDAGAFDGAMVITDAASDARATDASHGDGATAGDSAMAASCVVPDRSHTHALAPAADPATNMSAALVTALQAAAHDRIATVIGPSGESQGIVYLPAGEYAFEQVQLDDTMSNVRVEIEPGATIHGVPGVGGSGTLIVFGTPTSPVRNITFTAGDGQCGPGRATPVGTANKPSTTGFRGNLPGRMANGSYGMANEPVPFDAHWDVTRMWVLDLDPRAQHTSQDHHGLSFPWCYDVLVEKVFSIQNAERLASGPDAGVSEVPDATSQGAVMTFTPFIGSVYAPEREANHLAHRVTLRDHYNILSPAGYGPNQITACFDCTVTDVFSHGGTTLRLETDGIKPLCGYDACQSHCDGGVPLGPNGVGFDRYGMIDALTASRIEGVDGDRIVSLSPHCLPNGVVHIDDVRGVDMYELIRVTDLSGSFSSDSTVSNVQGTYGTSAQQPQAMLMGWQPAASWKAFSDDASHYDVHTSGSLCWPAMLSDGELPHGGPTPTRPPCPAWP